MRTRNLASLCALVCFAVPSVRAQSSLAPTPPMGWNSWNHFACRVTAADVRGAADAIAKNGMKDAGYVYVTVDYLKYDWCSASQVYPVSQIREVYKKMYDALRKTGRPIVYSLCQYGWDLVWRWGADVGGNLWRTTGDIQDRYDSMATIGFGQARKSFAIAM